MKLYVLEPYPVRRHMGTSPTRRFEGTAMSNKLKLQFMVNEWWTRGERTNTFSHFYLFIYLLIFLWFGFSFRSTDVLDCIESRRNIFGFWILFIIPVPLNPSLPPPPPPTSPPAGDTGKGFHFDLFSYTVSFPSWTSLCSLGETKICNLHPNPS